MALVELYDIAPSAQRLEVFRNDISDDFVCQLIDITPEQQTACCEFFKTHSFKKDRLKASEQILTNEQKDMWNRIKTTGPLPSEWNRMRSDRLLPELPSGALVVEGDERRLAELSGFFDALATNGTAIRLSQVQTRLLGRLDHIIQRAYSWARNRRDCPLTIRRDNPVEWTHRELVRYAEQICLRLILTEDEERLLLEEGSS